MNAFLLQCACGLDAFPGGGDLDQYPLATDTFFCIKADDLARPGDGGSGVEGEAGVHLGGNAAGNDAQDFTANGDGQTFAGIGGARLSAAGGCVHGAFNQWLIFRQSGGFQQQGRIGGGIHRRVFFDGLHVTGVSDYQCHGFQLVQLVGHGNPCALCFSGTQPYDRFGTRLAAWRITSTVASSRWAFSLMWRRHWRAPGRL